MGHKLLSGAGWLAVVVGGVHFEDVGNYAVNLDIPDEAGEEQLLGDSSTHQTQSRQAEQQLWKTEKEGWEGR